MYELTDKIPIRLEETKCKGCIHCMMRCPTEAIRVRHGKARIIHERCVSCGDCVRICPTRAKIAVFDPMAKIFDYKYKIAVPCPSIYGQFNNLSNINYILNALITLGFDEVAELAVGCEIASEATRLYLQSENVKKPIINSSCPAIVKLIQIRYGQLAPHISRVKTPEEIMAARAKDKAQAATGLPRGDIGVFIISPCPSKAGALGNADDIDGILGFSELYFKLTEEMDRMTKQRIQPSPISETGRLGLQWGMSGGESGGIKTSRTLAADGIENVLEVLSQLDHDKLTDLDFIELNACPGGCVGGVMNIENPFLAISRIRELRYTVPITFNRYDGKDGELAARWINNADIEPIDVFKLSDNRMEAIQKLQKIERIHDALPGIDCGGCGAPSCRAMAEDVVNKVMEMGACVFLRGDLRP